MWTSFGRAALAVTLKALGKSVIVLVKRRSKGEESATYRARLRKGKKGEKRYSLWARQWPSTDSLASRSHDKDYLSLLDEDSL